MNILYTSLITKSYTNLSQNWGIKIYKIETAEELVIARDTYRLTK